MIDDTRENPGFLPLRALEKIEETARHVREHHSCEAASVLLTQVYALRAYVRGVEK